MRTRLALLSLLLLAAPAAAQQQTINVGAAANDGTGDTFRAAFTKTNANFSVLFAALASKQPLSANLTALSAYAGVGTTAGTLAAGNDSRIVGAVQNTRQILAGTGLTGGGDLSADRTLALGTTGVTPGSYTSANLTVDAYGRLTAVSSGAGGAIVALGQVRLSYSSATTLLAKPFNGNQITINGANQTIPASGVSCSSTGIAAGTLTYEYLWMNGATMACEVSTTGHVTGANGQEVKSGDATRTLVGMAYVATAATFVDSAASRTVASWFNRQDRSLMVGSGTYTTSSLSPNYVELSTAQRVAYVSWADEAPDVQVSGFFSNNTAGSSTQLALATDGTTQGTGIQLSSAASGYTFPAFYRINQSTSEGYHYSTPVGSVGGNGGSYTIQTTGRVRS